MLFSNANEHRLTFKKTRFSTSELVDSHQFFTYGRGSDVFSLVSKIVDRIDPLHVLYDECDVYANLRVGTVEQAGVIADYGGMPPLSITSCSMVTRSLAATRLPRRSWRARSRVDMALTWAIGTAANSRSPCFSSPRFSFPSIIKKMICVVRW
ncbi:MAG: hypothetical protein ACYC67_15375 [Prosthecobacter sp.]